MRGDMGTVWLSVLGDARTQGMAPGDELRSARLRAPELGFLAIDAMRYTGAGSVHE